MTNQNIAFHLPADTGPSYWGPGDRYTFLVTGAQTNGAYFTAGSHLVVTVLGMSGLGTRGSGTRNSESGNRGSKSAPLPLPLAHSSWLGRGDAIEV